MQSWMVHFAPLKIKVLPDRLFVTNGSEFHGAEAIWYPYAMNALRGEAFTLLGVLEYRLRPSHLLYLHYHSYIIMVIRTTLSSSDVLYFAIFSSYL